MEFKCSAPVFGASSFPACVILTIIYALLIVLLIVGTLGLIFLSAKGRCVIKQLQFRIRYCTEGNRYPERHI
jgi:hypothetical protein